MKTSSIFSLRQHREEKKKKKPHADLEQWPDFLRIKSLHIFLFGADVYQTVVTPTLAFNGFGVMCAASEWKLLLFTLKHERECQEFNCVQALGRLQPACDLTGRVASPVPRRACKPPYPERVQVHALVTASACVCVREEVKCVAPTMS